MRILPEIKWFIKDYFGEDFLGMLIGIAAKEQNQLLMGHCQDIWYLLPGSKFNIRENPPGWDKFLELLET